ncbi:sulfite reductase flavoprotein subunit alpha [Saccharicrinis sp. FJH62]|uniref:diflavin oxidoreductase n=1 Tax=Saccharicrinis sp. FJH62 TaxID=3344657 RepID=UPI0035D4D9D5
MKKTFGLLSEDEQTLLNQLVEGMTKEQLLWTSGYLAGKGENNNKSGTKERPVMPNIQVLYGTHSGNSEVISEQLLQLAKNNGLDMQISIMEKYEYKNTPLLKNLIVVVSTHGEGEPPSNAMGFLDYLRDKNTPEMPELNYAVLGLGDSTYANFSQAGVDFHKALKKLKAKPILPIRKCDAEFMPDAKKWMDQIINHFSGNSVALKPEKVKAPEGGLVLGGVASAGFTVPSFKRVYDRNNPFYAKILKKKLLNGDGSGKEVYHFELSIRDSGFTYQPGDTLSIVGDNPPSLVEAILDKFSFSRDEEVVLDKQMFTLYHALRNYLEITVINPVILDRYNKFAGSAELTGLINDPVPLADYLYGSDVLDLLTDFPAKLNAQELVSVLRKLPPRKYSIASSFDAHPGEAHITVAAVRFEKNERIREGAISTFVVDRVKEGDRIPVFVQNKKKFKMPEDKSTPIIMIGPGTGIAPFRAFVQQRKHDGVKKGTWLFFGDQHEETDFLYGEEWNTLKAEGYLQKLDLAFSRDQDEKIYVQHRLLQKSDKVWTWLQKGASIYVCGDKKKMATDVHLALLDIVRNEGKMDINTAKQYLNQLVTDNRYQKDVY